MIKRILPNQFPPLLRHIEQSPKELYVRGGFDPDEKFIAIVGTRKASTYGKKIATQIASELARLNIAIVSGLAVGIDTFAHRAALAEGGRTIAVLGCGIDRIYPPENRDLAEKIINNGAIISEYPERTEPAAWRFPARNRIISGMSLATIVVEAGEKSGALITGRKAGDQGREVFAVTGDIDRPQAMGTALLLKFGAHPFTSVIDILENLTLQTDILGYLKENQLQNLSQDEQSIINLIQPGETAKPENLFRNSSLHISRVQSILSVLEIRGIIDRTQDGGYRRG